MARLSKVRKIILANPDPDGAVKRAEAKTAAKAARVAELTNLPFKEIDRRLNIKGHESVTPERGGHLSPQLYPEHKRLSKAEKKKLDKILDD